MSDTRIFVSHSHADDEFGRRLVLDMRQALGGEDVVWYDQLGGLDGGVPWWNKIVQELSARRTFVVVCSPEAMASPWVRDEINLAWQQKNSPAGKHIVPILYRDCEVREDLLLLQLVSFLPPKPYEDAFRELLRAVGIPLQTAATFIPVSVSAETHRDEEDLLRDFARFYSQQVDEMIEKGVTLNAQHRFAEAIPILHQATQLMPLSFRAWAHLGWAYVEGRNYVGALEATFRAIGLDQRQAWLWNIRGAARLGLGQYEEALTDFSRAIALDGRSPSAWMNRASALRALHREADAVKAEEQACKLGAVPTSREST